MKDIYTLVYFKPSATGYDYTDGVIYSDDEVTVSIFTDIKEAAEWMAETNAKIYNDGTLNRKPYNYINEPEYSFKILVNGLSTWSEDDYCMEDGVWDRVSDVEYEFNSVYNEKYRELKEFYEKSKNHSDMIKKSQAEVVETAKKYAEYLKLKGEFEKCGINLKNI